MFFSYSQPYTNHNNTHEYFNCSSHVNHTPTLTAPSTGIKYSMWMRVHFERVNIARTLWLYGPYVLDSQISRRDLTSRRVIGLPNYGSLVTTRSHTHTHTSAHSSSINLCDFYCWEFCYPFWTRFFMGSFRSCAVLSKRVNRTNMKINKIPFPCLAPAHTPLTCMSIEQWNVIISPKMAYTWNTVRATLNFIRAASIRSDSMAKRSLLTKCHHINIFYAHRKWNWAYILKAFPTTNGGDDDLRSGPFEPWFPQDFRHWSSQLTYWFIALFRSPFNVNQSERFLDFVRKIHTDLHEFIL